ncbi:MAG: peptidoglycan editing factor PgeF [Myxococcales bacterium]|nr:peptidoglycan editing factor PgeF [Myxococcales bacterium]
MWLQVPGFDACHAFSTRLGGVSQPPFDALDLSLSSADLAENARRFAASLGLTTAQLACVHQVHGSRIVEVVPAAAGSSSDPDRVAFDPSTIDLTPLAEADGLITQARGIALAVRTADCVPILIASDRQSESESPPAIAALHAGWRGTLDLIADRAVRLFGARFGIPVSRLSAAIGPCIGPCCYAVSQALAADFAARFGASCITGQPDKPHLDLREANRQALLAAGLAPDAIHVSHHCTACDGERFFSHRRDAGQTGRHLSVIVMDQR